MRRLFAALSCLAVSALGFAGPITITFLHTNDMHARIEPVKIKNGTYGGYARQKTLLDRFRAKDPNPVVLSGGDTFQGTLYFNVYQGLADGYFMNRLGYQAMAVGNHEFDLGVDALANFLKSVQFPLLACNLDLSGEPKLNGKIKSTHILKVGKEKLGLVGAVTPELPFVSSPGPTIKMLDTVASIKSAIAELQKEGCDKIVLLSHLGYVMEQEIAAQIPELDVIIGAHSHTLLGELGNPDLPKGEGQYPTVIARKDGSKCLVVASWEWGKVLGRLQVSFDAKGRVTKWQGAPVVIDQTVPEDPEFNSAIMALQKPIESLRRTIVINLPTRLDGDREKVRLQETTMANAIADGMLASAKTSGAVLAIMNGGGVRASLESGPVSYEAAKTVLPFDNTLFIMDLTGAEVIGTLEHGVSAIERGEGRFVQVSRGFSYTFDMSKPVGSRIVSASLNGEALDPAKTYRIVTNKFIANGGDGFAVLAAAKGTRLDSGMLDIDVFVAFLRSGDLRTEVEGRIKRLN